MNEYDYTGNKIKNYFTAYLQKCIRWKRWDFLKKKQKVRNVEKPLVEARRIENVVTIEEMIEIHYKEELLIKELKEDYLDWTELSNPKLANSLEKLREFERHLIYQHVFEEKPFKEICRSNGLTDKQVKAIYYYSVKKIRKWMGGEDNGI